MSESLPSPAPTQGEVLPDTDSELEWQLSRAVENMIILHPKNGDICCSSHPHTSAGRNLVVCIDGTSNQFSKKNTNIVELYSRLVKDQNQVTFYNSGIGTYATPSWRSFAYYKKVIGHKLDLAIAWRFERILLDAYRWLSERYKDGDKIFLFGFSRGAYQARVLSAMIEKVGLIHEGNEDQIPFAYELYCASSDTSMPKQSQDMDMAARFKKTFSRKDVKVHFVGAWDTVSAIGLVKSDQNLPLTTLGMKHVCYFRHALALHERRVKFLPEYAYGGVGPLPHDCCGAMPHTKEVWFAGTHSDIGGGNTENIKLNTNGPSLRWMITEARKAGLCIESFSGNWATIERTGEINESLTIPWWPLEFLPLKRLQYNRDHDETASFTYWPHLGCRRDIANGQLIHNTVYRSDDVRYKEFLPAHIREGPNAAPVEPDDADHLTLYLVFTVKNLCKARDPESEEKIIKNLEKFIENLYSIEDLTFMDLYDSLFRPPKAILDSDPRLVQTRATMLALNVVMNKGLGRDSICGPNEKTRKHMSLMPPIIQRLLKSPASNSVAKSFLSLRCLQKNVVDAVSVSPNGALIAWIVDHNIVVYEFESLESHASMSTETHSGHIAFSRDSDWIIAGYANGSIGFWYMGTISQLCFNNKHPTRIMAVAFSPCTNALALSASSDGSIFVWRIPNFRSHGQILAEDGLTSAAFSPDGSKIISSHMSGNIHVWDAQGRHLFRYHLPEDVASVAFSVDGNHVFAGTRSGRIWELYRGDGDTILKVEVGKVGEVARSLAVSSDGKYLAAIGAIGFCVWNIQESNRFQMGAILHQTPNSVVFSHQHPSLLIITHANQIEFWDVGGPAGDYIVELLLKQGTEAESFRSGAKRCEHCKSRHRFGWYNHT
ncbi:hypothetical protein VNI00_005099 [Paramarasmius palmivorus]|uniref:T6SS Phospholipase effector Tle1-like catalytic domain-containing protein n=1 Tax=Paramarasmius palmivorus TaxID=297713 RepID=A0AAW0DHH1_9AGAR